MSSNPDDICPRPSQMPQGHAQPLAAPIWPASVYRCDSPQQALGLLSGDLEGYVYQRDGHPNAEVLAEKCRQLHGADRAMITSCGMSALAAVALSQLNQGDHAVLSNQLYGRSLDLLDGQMRRLGVQASVVDTCNLDEVAATMRKETRLVLVETITNPLLRVSNIAALSELAHANDALLVVDNTFASPVICRPLQLGADVVVESISKIVNGHSDVMLGMVCGRERDWENIPSMVSIWGLASGPFDCWLAARGLATLPLRARGASENALAVAEFLSGQEKISRVCYPGLANHADHAIAAAQFGNLFGFMVTFDLAGELPAAERFITAAAEIPFCPSLGEVSTTLSHPASTSHRGLSPAERRALGIHEGTIRLSVGVESQQHILASLESALAAV